MRGGFRVHDRLSRYAFAGVVLVSLIVLFAPAGDVPSGPPGVDKVVHAGLFLALALTGRWAGLRRGTIGLRLVVYAAVSEVLQGLTPLERTASVADWLADVAGLVLGLALWELLGRRAERD
jgi:VanZ family protein